MTENDTVEDYLNRLMTELRETSRKTHEEIMSMKTPGDMALLKILKLRDVLIERKAIVEHMSDGFAEFGTTTEQEMNLIEEIRLKMDVLCEHYDLRIAHFDIMLGFPRCGNCKHSDNCSKEFGNEFGEYVREPSVRDYGHCNFWESKKE